ncbi:uncharacterized protein EAF01_001152 [Botrytis porri]|nr:uncharacterized protein EAF01_001152 [Botrytis porri]KAF7912131.1 hypothetical protein EAF01_001152 [Botrytis porri]
MIAKISSFYPTSNFKPATSQPHPWKNTAKILLSLILLTGVDLDFLIYYFFYHISRKLLAISGLGTRGKLKLLAITLAFEPCWFLIGAAHNFGEMYIDITLERILRPLGEKKNNATEKEEEKEEKAHSANYPEPISVIINRLFSLRDGIEYNIFEESDETDSYKRIIGKPKETQKPESEADKKENKYSSALRHSNNQSSLSQARARRFLDFMSFDTEKGPHNHLNKYTVAEERISAPYYLTPLPCAQFGPTTIVRLPSTLRSRIRCMIDSVTRELKSEKRHKALRLIVETEQYVEKLFLRSESSMPEMVGQMEELERKLKGIFEDAEIAEVENEREVGDDDDEDEEEELASGILTPSTSSGASTPIVRPATPWVRSEFAFGDATEDEEEDMSTGVLPPSTSSTPSTPDITRAIPTSPPPPPPSPSTFTPKTTIAGRPWHLFLVDTIYKCDNSLDYEWRTPELFNAWCRKNSWFAVTEGEIALLEKWKWWALDDSPVVEKWNW